MSTATQAPSPDTADEIRTYEAAFRKAGLPLFIEGHSASTDVFNRAALFLSLVFVVEMLGSANVAWPLWANALAIVGGAVLLLCLLGVVNRFRGRPFLALRPERVDLPELAGFVLLPALLPLVFGGQWKVALVTILGNLILLGLVYLIVGYALASIVRWAATRIFAQLASSFRLLMRALPLLIFFALLLFYTTEIWQVFAHLTRGALILTAGLFLIFGMVFLVSRLPGEVHTLEHDAGDPSEPLTRRQRTNVALVMFVSQALQVVVVAAGIFLFFVLLGALTVRPDVQQTWTQVPPNVLVEFELLDQPITITEDMLGVAAGIAAFSALYYTIAVLTDVAYRREFLNEITEGMKETFLLRDRYLDLIRERSGDAGPPAPPT